VDDENRGSRLGLFVLMLFVFVPLWALGAWLTIDFLGEVGSHGVLLWTARAVAGGVCLSVVATIWLSRREV
jgi:hypothetical protein